MHEWPCMSWESTITRGRRREWIFTVKPQFWRENMRSLVKTTTVVAAVGVYLLSALPGEAQEATTIQQSPEQKVLDRGLGSWEQTYTFFKAKWTPEQAQGTGTASCTRILNGRFVETKLELSDGSTLLMLATYDTQRKCYRRWEFHSNGQAAEKIGEWDADAKCMTWSGSADNGRTSTTTDRYVDADTLESRLVIKDRDGRVCLHVEAKTTRAK